MQKIKFLIILFVLPACLLLHIQGCRNQDEKLPENVLNKQTMVDLITDMQLVEAALAVKQSQNATDPAVARIYFDSLFAKYQVTKNQVDSSLKYYSRRPEVFEELYSQAIIKLSRIEHENAMLEKAKADTLLAKDSINLRDTLYLPEPQEEKTEPANQVFTEQPLH